MHTIGKEVLTHLSINPNYIAIYYESIRGREKNDNPTIQQQQPKSNNPKRFISEKSQKRIRKAVNWLSELAITKDYYNPKKDKMHNFKVNFITLTLPTTQKHLDTTIKKKCLDPLLTNLRKTHQLNNYIWRAEAQANGSIHFHILTDCYIDHYILRKLWNRQLERCGYISDYSKKFSGLTYKDYCQLVDPQKKIDQDILLRRWNYGNKTNWKEPNTTDIHSIHKVRNIAAYVSKYMSKDEVEKDEDGRYPLKSRRIEGKKVGISEKLSKVKGWKEEMTREAERVINWVIEQEKPKVIIEDWYSIVCISFDQLRKYAAEWIEKLRREIMKKYEYIPSPAPAPRKRRII